MGLLSLYQGRVETGLPGRRHRASGPKPFCLFQKTLKLGDSFAARAEHRRDLPPGTVAKGWSGGRISNERFREWAVNEVRNIRPRFIVLIVGGNDIASGEFTADSSRSVSINWFERFVSGVCTSQLSSPFPLGSRRGHRMSPLKSTESSEKSRTRAYESNSAVPSPVRRPPSFVLTSGKTSSAETECTPPTRDGARS